MNKIDEIEIQKDILMRQLLYPTTIPTTTIPRL